MISRLALLGWLGVVWVILWGDVSPANILSGLAVGGLLVVLFPLDLPPQPAAFRPLAVARFLIVFAWKLVEASAIVAWEVVTPRNRINEGIVAVPIMAASDLVITIVANSITLTPGTLTLEVDREQGLLFVHVLHLRDVEDVRQDVRDLEALAIRAFGSTRARAALRTAERRLARRSGEDASAGEKGRQ